uniref:Troponin I (Fragments) n=1 Tax=Chionoecetes opilio TaxID=41210 RepID=TNNI_CHIOP|nr:RecName: Full=Troponin I [Chionoecetes opilio]
KGFMTPERAAEFNFR